MKPAKYLLALRMLDRHGALQQLTGLLYRRRCRFEALYSAAIPDTEFIMVYILLADTRAGRIAAELESLYDVQEIRKEELRAGQDSLLRLIRASSRKKTMTDG